MIQIDFFNGNLMIMSEPYIGWMQPDKGCKLRLTGVSNQSQFRE